MTSRISRPAYGTDFFTILNEFWTDFLQFSAKDGGVSHPPHSPNVRPWRNVVAYIIITVLNQLESSKQTKVI